MTRIAATLVIVLGTLALGDTLGRPAFAESLPSRPVAGVDIVQPLTVRSGRIVSLLLALEALRQVPLVSTPQKG